jgi:hypothetical protein
MRTPEQNMSIASGAEGLHTPEDHGPEFWSAWCKESVCIAQRELLTPGTKAHLIAEVEQLRAQVAELQGMVESHMDMARMEWECVPRLERAERVISAAQRVDACLYAFQGSEMHIEPNGCLTRLHDALADAGRTIGDGVIDGSVP